MSDTVTVTTQEYNDKLVIVLDKKWKKVFGGSLSFNLFIDKEGRMNFVSNQNVQ